MPRPYVILDVFTSTPLEGNGLAVVLDSTGLTSAAMQRIAREFNLSETVFVLPPDNPVHEAKVRIFTPAEELPFAGHPTVATAVLLAIERGRTASGDGILILEEGAGPVRCAVSRQVHARMFAPMLGIPEDPATGAAAVVMAAVLRRFDAHPPAPTPRSSSRASRWGGRA